MRRLLVLAVLSLVLATTARPDDATDFSTATKTFDAALAKKDCVVGAPAAAAMTASPSFAALPDSRKLSVWTFGATCAWKVHDVALALEDARRATALPNAPDWLWQMRLVASFGLHRPSDAADAVESILDARPAVVTSMDAMLVSEIVGDLVVGFNRVDVASRLLGGRSRPTAVISARAARTRGLL